MKLEELRAVKLFKATHIKTGWDSCRVQRWTAGIKCCRCLGFGHLAAQCGGTNRSMSYWNLHAQNALLALR